MPSIRKRTTAAGAVFYEVWVSRGRGKSYLTRRWYPPEGWSQKAIDRELANVAAEFERQSDAGEVITRAEQREREAAKILTLRQYGERVFMPAKTVTMSENARTSYQGNLIRWIYPVLGDVKLPEIIPAQLSALTFWSCCSSCGRHRPALQSQSGYSPRRAARSRCTRKRLRSIFALSGNGTALRTSTLTSSGTRRSASPSPMAQT